jgi:hypothetical protein
MTSRQTADAFFLSEAAVLAGQAAVAGFGPARGVSAALSAAGLGVELGYSLDRDPVLVVHMGVLYGVDDPPGSLPRHSVHGVDELLAVAARLRADCPQAFRGTPAPLPPRRAAPGVDLLVSGRAEASAKLPPLVGRAFTLARCGELVWGDWWLRSLDAEKFVLASRFGLLPPICAEPAAESFVIEAWPADASGRRLAGQQTTMVHVPVGCATRLRLVDADPSSGARRRTDENLRRVFG